MKYESVIGLEVHVELKTKTKIFCGCSTEFGAEPNTHVCPVCLGLPGVLPVLNKEVLHYAVKAGLALHCDILPFSKFDRKNYYYPDLPKNFQTSQFDLPICKGGYIDIDVDGKQRRIHLTRIHMEEDAGKLVHSGGSIANSDSTSVDYNRTGVPLLEIVGEPELRSGAEARAYLEKLRRYLDSGDLAFDFENAGETDKGNILDFRVGYRGGAGVGNRERIGDGRAIRALNAFDAGSRSAVIMAQIDCFMYVDGRR